MGKIVKVRKLCWVTFIAKLAKYKEVEITAVNTLLYVEFSKKSWAVFGT
jgi:hypothetical protein